jgi:hypothetical protein
VFHRVLQTVSLLCLTILCLFYPILESLDPWDSREPSSDAEIQLIALLTFVGIMFVLARVLATLTICFVLVRGFQSLRASAGGALTFLRRTFEPLVTASPPPLPLRI